MKPHLLQICSLMRGGIAERGGIRVGHRIIEINGQSVVATSHDKIIQTLTNAVGEVRTHLQGPSALAASEGPNLNSHWVLQNAIYCT